MPLIAKTLQQANELRAQFGLDASKTWSEMADNVLVLTENNVTLEFTTMNGSAAVKQADIIMVTYPLNYQNNYTPDQSLRDLNYVRHPSILSTQKKNSLTGISYKVRERAVRRRTCDDVGHLRSRREHGVNVGMLFLHICPNVIPAVCTWPIFPNV